MVGTTKMDRITSTLLSALVCLDFTLAATGLFLPKTWFALFHGGEGFDDPHGLLARSAGGWLAFAIVQLFVLLRHRARPELLLLVAGIRLGDMLTDAAYLLSASKVTALGAIALALAGPGNLILGLYFLRAARKSR